MRVVSFSSLSRFGPRLHETARVYVVIRAPSTRCSAQVVAMFAEYCSYRVEPVDVEYVKNGVITRTETTPQLAARTMTAPLRDVRGVVADAMDASLSEKDAQLLDACRWDRFFAPVSSESSRLREGHAGPWHFCTD